MKAGTIFEHPSKDGGVVRLIAVRGGMCDTCVFRGSECQNYRLSRERGITGICVEDRVNYVLADEPITEEPIAEEHGKLDRIMELIEDFTDTNGNDGYLRSEIGKILEE